MKANYTLLSEFDVEENKRIKRELECPHSFWSTRCGACAKILASDHHVNFHTDRSHKSSNKVAIVIFNKDSISQLDITRIKKLKREYDQVIAITDIFESLELLSELKSVWRASYNSLYEEVKIQRKYRLLDISQLDCILYPDTSSEIRQHMRESANFYKKNEVNIVNIQ